MANNFNVLDATGTTVPFASTDIGSGLQLPKKKINDGTNDILSASATNLAAKSTINSLLHTLPGQWVATHAPAVNTAAVASQASAGAGVRNVCNAIAITLANDSTGSVQTVLAFNLRDGGTGAGTILATFTLSLPATAGECRTITLSGLSIPGSAATAMTLESASAPASHTAASCTIIGTTAA